MRRSAFLISFLFLFLAVRPAFSQELTFERAYSDYQRNLSLYKKAEEEYALARANYLSSGTLTAKNSAFAKTLAMLQARDESVITHFAALRAKIAEIEGIENSEREEIFTKIDNEVVWYQEHKGKLGSASTLQDLVLMSDEAKLGYEESSILIYQALGVIQRGKVSTLRRKVEEAIAQIEAKTASIKAEGEKDVSIIERWIGETSDRVEMSKFKESAAKELILEVKPGRRNQDSLFLDAQGLVVESNQSLKEATGFLKEIIREIKTED